MSWWDRYKAWQLETRGRYLATAVPLRALFVFFFLWLFVGSSAGEALLLTAIFAVVAILLWGFWYYPRAKAQGQHGSVATRTTHG